MEGRQKEWNGKALMLMGLLLVSFVGKIASLSVTVNDIECIYEYVLYEDDTISGNFVVVDHDIFWGSDHPGLDLIVSSSFPKTQLHRGLSQIGILGFLWGTNLWGFCGCGIDLFVD